MEGEAFILTQSESIVVPTTTTSNSSTTFEDVGLNVNKEVVDVTKEMTIEK